MLDRSYNLFLYIDDNSITAIGVVTHDIEGSDEDKLLFLRSQTNLDCHAARRFPIEPSLPWGRYEAMMRVGSSPHIDQRRRERGSEVDHNLQRDTGEDS
jgi:hypothetical protein